MRRMSHPGKGGGGGQPGEKNATCVAFLQLEGADGKPHAPTYQGRPEKKTLILLVTWKNRGKTMEEQAAQNEFTVGRTTTFPLVFTDFAAGFRLHGFSFIWTPKFRRPEKGFSFKSIFS